MSAVPEDLKVDSDGLVSADVHRWSEQKYRLLALYDQLFSSGMKNKWGQQNQCQSANTPFFFKQWGGVRKKAAGRKLLGRTYDELPCRVQNPALSPRLRLQHALDIEGGRLVQIARA